jgi:hypothetical protein
VNKKILALILIVFTLFISYRFIDNSKQSFEVYLASGTSSDLNKLILSTTPVITDDDILSYIWDTHEIVFNESYLSNRQSKSPNQSYGSLSGFSLDGGSKLLGASYKDKFVIVANGERIYYGYFPKPVHFSSINGSPLIVEKPNGIVIELLYGDIDVRNDRRIYSVLRRIGKLD